MVAVESAPSEEFHLRVTCKTPQATEALGKAIASIVKSGDVIILTGELGAGKTTFVKGVVAALGGSMAVTSPTFVLCHLYDTGPVVAHIDCWRFERPEEVIDLALSEILDDGGIAFIEWAEIATKSIGGPYLTMSFGIDDNLLTDEMSDEDFFAVSRSVPRTVSLEPTGGDWSLRLATLEVNLCHESLIEQVIRVVQ